MDRWVRRIWGEYSKASDPLLVNCGRSSIANAEQMAPAEVVERV